MDAEPANNVCPICSTANPSTNKFCGNCGGNLPGPVGQSTAHTNPHYFTEHSTNRYGRSRSPSRLDPTVFWLTVGIFDGSRQYRAQTIICHRPLHEYT
jgi:hypothetical protein